MILQQQRISGDSRRKEGREKEGGRKVWRWKGGERDWDSMVDSTTILDIYSRVEDVRHCLEVSGHGLFADQCRYMCN